MSGPKILVVQNGQRQLILGDRGMWEPIEKGGRGAITVGRGGEVPMEKKPSKSVKNGVTKGHTKHNGVQAWKEMKL